MFVFYHIGTARGPNPTFFRTDFWTF